MGRYGNAEFSKTPQVIADVAIPLSFIEIIGPKVTIGNAFGKDMIDGEEKNAGNGYHSAFGASAGCKTSITMFEVGVSFSGCTPGRLCEDAAKPAISFTDRSAFSLAGTLVVTRANAGPGSQVLGGRKLRHVGTNFRNQDGCCVAPNPWDRLK